MWKKPVELTIRRNKPVLEVNLPKPLKSDVERYLLAAGDNADALRRVAEIFPEVIPRRVTHRLRKACVALEKRGGEEFERLGVSLSHLLDLAGGKSGKWTTGSHVSVLIKDDRGEKILVARAPRLDKVVSLRELVEKTKAEIQRDRDLTGTSTKGRRDAECLDAAKRRYERVFDLSQKGFYVDEIPRMTEGVSIRTCYNWLGGELLPVEVRPRTREERARVFKPITIPAGESTSFAYLLGAYAGARRFRSFLHVQDFSHKNPEVTDELADCIKDAVGIEVRKCEKLQGRYKTIRLVNMSLSLYLNGITEGNTRLPWEHLVTQEERVAFMRGFFDFNSSINKGGTKTAEGFNYHPRIDVQKLGNERLIKEMAILLKSVGILPVVRLGARPTLYLFDYDSVNRFIEQGGYTSRLENTKLEALFYLGYSRRGYSPEEYERVMDYARTRPGMTIKEIAQNTGVAYNIAREWLKRSGKPRSLGRRAVIEAFETQTVSPDTLGYLAREVGVHWLNARAIASTRSIEDIRKCCDILRERGIDPKTKPDLLKYTPDALERRLSKRVEEPATKPELPTDVEAYMRLVEGRIPLSADEERQLIPQAKKNKQEAIERIVLDNQLTVIRMARQFAGSGIPLMDLIMAGNEGLVKALKKFEFKVNPQTGEFHRFSSYAKPWVRGEIINTINTETKGPKAIPLEEFHDAGHELTPEKIVGGRMDTAKLRELMDAALTSVGVDKRTCRLFARLCDLASGEETKETPEVPPSKALEIRREVFEKLRQNKDKPEVKALIDHLVEK